MDKNKFILSQNRIVILTKMAILFFCQKVLENAENKLFSAFSRNSINEEA